MEIQQLNYVNAKIGRHSFIFSSLEPEQSQENFNIIYTPLINGDSFVSYGEKKLMKWTAKTSKKITENDTETLNLYNDMIQELESSPQKVYIPKINYSFTAMIRIKKSFDHDWLELEIDIQQISDDVKPRIDLRHIFVGERISVFDYDSSSKQKK